ncbi:MAG: hypothetical protein WDZ76_02760 [Pseudohongiellaceae bacterium]
MKTSLPGLLLLLCSSLASAGALAAEACEPDGNVRFVCGVENPEDLIAIPGTPWVIASGRVSAVDGFIYAVDTRDHSSTVLFPGAGSATAHDTANYSDCPGPARFQPHGVALRDGGDNRFTLFVVGHGEREAIEVFSLDASGAPPEFTWVGCIMAPEGTRLNSVTALPDDAIAATNFNTSGGELWEWDAASGWAEVPGSSMPGPNGLVSSPDGRWFYIGGWTEEALIRLSRGQNPVQKDTVGVGFHIDNVRWAADGTLLVGGQYGGPRANIGGCLNGGACADVSSRAAKVHPDSLQVQQLVDYPSNDYLPFGTVAIQVGEEIWLGGIAGGDRIARFAD